LVRCPSHLFSAAAAAAPSLTDVSKDERDSRNPSTAAIKDYSTATTTSSRGLQSLALRQTHARTHPPTHTTTSCISRAVHDLISFAPAIASINSWRRFRLKMATMSTAVFRTGCRKKTDYRTCIATVGDLNPPTRRHVYGGPYPTYIPVCMYVGPRANLYRYRRLLHPA